MSVTIDALVAAWTAHKHRVYHMSELCPMVTPEERQAWETEAHAALAEHNRQVAEKAWDEGFRAEHVSAAAMVIWGHKETPNPYTKKEN